MNDRNNIALIEAVPTSSIYEAPESTQPAVKFRVVTDSGKTRKMKKLKLNYMLKVCISIACISSLGQPKIVELDFDKHYLDYSRERSGIVPNSFTLEALSVLISRLGVTNPQALLTYANILYDVSNEMYRNTVPVKGQRLEDPTRYLPDIVEKAVEQVNVPVYPDDELIYEVLGNTAYYVRARLLPESKPYIPNSLRDSKLPQIVYVPFRSGTNYPNAQITQSGILLVDEKLRTSMSDARTREAVLPILQSMLVKGGIIQNLLSTYISKSTNSSGAPEEADDRETLRIVLSLFEKSALAELKNISNIEDRVHFSELMGRSIQ